MCPVIQASADLEESVMHQHTVYRTHDSYVRPHFERKCVTSRVSNVIYNHHTLDSVTHTAHAHILLAYNTFTVPAGGVLGRAFGL